MVELYKWCPSCEMEEHKESDEPKVVYLGTDGFGQPVRFSDCDCGSVYGWFDIEYYKQRDSEFEFDKEFKEYLQYRINLYYVDDNQNET